MVKIAYFTRINFFSGKANIHTISKTCEALSQINEINLKLISVDSSLNSKEKEKKFFAEHDISHKFPIVSLNSLANRYKNSQSFILYIIGVLLGNLSLLKYLWLNRNQIDLFYFRDHLIFPVAFFAKYILNKKVIYESHYVLTKKIGQWLTRYCVKISDGVVAIAITLKDFYNKFNKNIIVAFCASSDKEKFKTDFTASYFKKKVGLEESKFYLVYTGNIDVTGNGDSYGVEDIVQALPYFSEDTRFVVVGKKTKGRHVLERLAESLGVSNRFKCLPWVSRDEVIDYVLAADILIIPKSGAKAGNSPTKMFEYLATGRPIIAANTTAMREVLHDKENALLVDFTKPQAWVEAVDSFKNNFELSNKIVSRALQDADLYTWETRAELIGSFIKKIYA